MITHPRSCLTIYALIILSALLALTQNAMAQVCAPPPSGLVAWLPGDGNAHDVAGRNNVTLQPNPDLQFVDSQSGTPPTFTSGKVGQAFSLDGVDDFVQIAAPLYTPTGGTVDFWFKRTGSGRTMIGSYGGSGSRRAPTLYVTPTNTFGWEFGSLNGRDTGSPITLNQWYHAALTYDRNFNVRVYLNGVLVGQGSSANPGGFFTEVHVGHYPGSTSSFYFTGLIDEPHFYNRALTQAEIQAIVTADTAGLCLPVNDKFANATTLSGASGMVNGSNVYADNESQGAFQLEPGHGGPAAKASVWYNWAAPANGSVTFNTTGSSFDTVLAAYVGNNVLSLSKVASNDDAGGPTSSITFNTTAGTLYRIAVDGKNGLTGSVTLNWVSSGSTVSTASISGRVTNINGVINVGDASNVTLNGSAQGRSISNGVFTFAGLAPSGTYTLSLSDSNINCNTCDQTITLRGNVIADDFVARTPTYTVAGFLFSPTNSPLVGATVLLSGPTLQPTPIITHSDGSYTSPPLSILGSYTLTPLTYVTPAGVTYGTYSPVPRTYQCGPGTPNTFCTNAANQNYTAQNNPTPTISNVSPASVVQGGNGTPLAVNGTNFIAGSVVRLNDADRITTFVSATQLTTQFTTADIQSAGTNTVKVFTPQPGGGTSNSVNFTVTSVTPIVQFSQAAYSAGEGDGRATVTVTRTGDTSGSATVDYRTADTDTFTVGCADTVNNHGGAYGRCDFATAVGSLQFAAGDTSKTITVPVIDDVHVEGNETFQLILSNAAGASLGATTTATVTIQDNDVTGAPNPVYDPNPANTSRTIPFFVRQQYLDFLSREPEAGEPWSGVLNRCLQLPGGDPQNINNLNPNSPSAGCDRILVSLSFFGSPEFQLKGFYVFRFYKLAYNRLPEYLEIIPDMSFVAGTTPAEVFARKAQLATLFTGRTDFMNTYGSLSNAQYVNALLARYQLTQITTFDPANPDGTGKVTLTNADLLGRLNASTLSRAQVFRAIADSDQAGAAEFNNAFVGMQYYGYLRRKPEPAGYQSWLQVLQSGDQRMMVNGFLNSPEYRLRFGSPNQ